MRRLRLSTDNTNNTLRLDCTRNPEENKEMMKFLIETYVGYLKKTTHGKKAYDYSYKLRNNFDSSYYHDIIIQQ